MKSRGLSWLARGWIGRAHAALILLLATPGCTPDGSMLAHARRSPQLLIVWLDASLSAVPMRTRMRQWYASATAPERLRSGDVIIVGRLDERSYALRQLRTIAIPALDPITESTDDFWRREVETRRSVAVGFDSTLAGPPSPGTAILEALQATSAIAAAYPSHGLAVVVLSDGVADERQLHLRAGAPPPDGEALGSALVRGGFRLRAGTCARMIGVGSDPHWRPGQLEAFWTDVLRHIGAEQASVGPTDGPPCRP